MGSKARRLASLTIFQRQINLKWSHGDQDGKYNKYRLCASKIV